MLYIASLKHDSTMPHYSSQDLWGLMGKSYANIKMPCWLDVSLEEWEFLGRVYLHADCPR